MPLRDHFRSPLDDERSWDELHGIWPAVLALDLNRRLPPRYVAGARVHLGGGFEVDIAAQEKETTAASGVGLSEACGVAVVTWAPPRPTLAVATDVPEQDEYEVRVYDTKRHRRLVAAVEIISPGNKDRPEERRMFVSKCAAMLQQGVAVALVDLVTTRQANLYNELLETIGQTDPVVTPVPALYAAACRWRRGVNDNGALKDPAAAPTGRFEAWAHSLEIGRPLPTLPLWLAEDLAVPLELEATYEEACRGLRIG